MNTTFHSLPKEIRIESPLPYEDLKSEVNRYYSKVERYDWVTDTKYPEKLFHTMRARKIASIVNGKIHGKDSVVLDVGCGTGLITRYLNSHNIFALDMNSWALERAKMHTLNNNVTFIPGDAEDLPFPTNTFDVIVCTEVLEHLVKPELALREIYRVLKPGAVLVGSVPSKSLIWKYRKYISTTSPASEPFHNNYTTQEFRPMLRGFEIICMKRHVFGLTLIFVARKP